MQQISFTPALGRAGFLRGYDQAIRLLTRERTWRMALLRQVDPGEGDVILDVGCGTGTFAIMLKRKCPASHVIGLDPDPEILKIAARKAADAGVAIEWRNGFASEAAAFVSVADKAVSSLVLHQVGMLEKRKGIAAMFAAVRPGGAVHIADYASQRGTMRALFRLTVQQIDGLTDTQPNADGALEAILSERSGSPVRPTEVVNTPTGAISLFRVPKSRVT